MNDETETKPASEGRETTRWNDQGVDPKAAGLLTAGVDIGSVSAQAVVCVDGAPYAWASMRNGPRSRESAREVMALALEGTGLALEDFHFVVGTGYGRANVPFAHKRISEIHCHARGGSFIYGDRVRTLLDVGGQDYKVIRCDARGKVKSFLLSDKCAAGTGRGVEIFAELLQLPLSAVGPVSLAVDEEPPPVSSACVVFAKSEAVRLLRSGWDEAQVLAAYLGATCDRLVALLEQVGVVPEFGITGGIAKNSGVVARLERKLGLEALSSDWDPQLAGALGGALCAAELEQKKRRKAARPNGPRQSRRSDDRV